MPRSPTYTALSGRTIGRFAFRMVASVFLILAAMAAGDFHGDEPKGRFVSYLYPFLTTVALLGVGLLTFIRNAQDGNLTDSTYALGVMGCGFVAATFVPLGLVAIARDLNAGR